MASRASSPLPRDKNESDMTHFNGPIVKCSESEAVSTSTELVASVTSPDLRYPCSLAGKNSSATVAQHLDGNRLRATLAPNVGLEDLSIPCSFPDCRSNMGHLGLSAPPSFSEQRLDARHEVLSREINSVNDRFPNERLEALSIPASFPERRSNERLGGLSIPASFPERRPNASLGVLSEYRFPSEWSSFPQKGPNVALECEPIQTSLSENRSRTAKSSSRSRPTTGY